MLLVGSRALELAGVPVHRDTVDLDIICWNREFNAVLQRLLSSGYTIERLTQDGTHKILKAKGVLGQQVIIDASILDDLEPVPGSDYNIWWELCLNGKYTFETTAGILGPVTVAKPEVIYMLKLSHKYRDHVHFEKTRQDILELQRQGYSLSPELEVMLKFRIEATQPKGYKLNVKKSEFFTTNVQYTYDHDSLHRAVAVDSVPAYLSYLADDSEVMCDGAKFEALPFQTKLNGVIEEAYVLALERAVIPHATHPDKAFRIALQKICTVTTGGWFREFAWQNYDRILQEYSQTNTDESDYVLKFCDAFQLGLILPYTGEKK